MKKKIMISICVLLALVLLIPSPRYLDDGGTVIYKSVTYEVSKVHALATLEEIEQGKEYYEGTIIKILGIEIFNNVK